MGSGAGGPIITRPFSTGAISWGAAVLASGRPCLLLRAQALAPDSASRLDRIRRVHEAARISEIPLPIAWDFEAASPWLALECDPIGTLGDLRERVPKRSVPYAEAIVLTLVLGRVLEAAHSASSGPYFLEALSPSQVIVDRTGTLRVIGLGFDDEAWAEHAYRAPTVAMGAPSTTSSDVHMCVLFLRSHTHLIQEIPPMLARLLRGEPGPLERAFARVLFGVLTQASKIDGPSSLRRIEKFWSAMDVAPDEDGFARRAREALDDTVVSLEVAHDYAWFSVDGGPRHDLRSREPVRKVFRALIEAGGKPLTTDEVVQASWPGEVLVGSSGPDRFYVAISSLRKLDLRHSLVREQGGYALRARARFVAPRASA
jgi:hypothetical protein